MADQEQFQAAQAEEEKRQAMEERKQMMLQSLLTPEAKERRQPAMTIPLFARIALVKPGKADDVTNQIISMANRGVLSEKITEERLKQMLESSGNLQQMAKTSKVTIQRKKYARDEEEDEYDL